MISDYSVEYRDKNAPNFQDYVVFREWNQDRRYSFFIPRTKFLKLMGTLELPNDW